MKPVRLYIENFMCHESSFIDFTQFNSAIIVGKIENNDLFSNGVGKTTIFKAIEYVLFNQTDVKLEKLIRDDTNYCKVVFDFLIDQQEYRVSRTRTKKGNTDLSLFRRNNQFGSEHEVYHSGSFEPISDDKFWKNISGSRASDTEKDLDKLIKINFKSFRTTVHFMQNDFSGLTTATPEKRKSLLKDVLNIIVYSKLEKIAKDKANSLIKEIDKNKILIDNLGNADKEIETLQIQHLETLQELSKKDIVQSSLNNELKKYNNIINDLNTIRSNLENSFNLSLTKEKQLSSDKSRIEISIKEYSSKRSNIEKTIKDLLLEIDGHKNNQLKLAELDYSQIDILERSVEQIQNQVLELNSKIKNNILICEELKIPLPKGSVCKNCRQPMTEEHRKKCLQEDNVRLQILQNQIQECKKDIISLNKEMMDNQRTINSLKLSRDQLSNCNIVITNKNKEINDKKSLYDEYDSLLSKFKTELAVKVSDLNSVREELSKSFMEEDARLKTEIAKNTQIISDLNNDLMLLNKQIAHLTSRNAVIIHSIIQKKESEVKKHNLLKSVSDLESKYSIYPLVLQAFSSTGIPNLIIQNVLDDLQTEANNLLSQLKPGLQLSFFLEKTKGDGSEADTLDIIYNFHGKERTYEQLSGAMKLTATFSLKLGLSFILQKMIGTNVKFLLLDEIDQALDKAGTDAFADIVKFFQKDFSILVITHNDRLKDKFTHAICVDCVEQNSNMVSRAKVVSSW